MERQPELRHLRGAVPALVALDGRCRGRRRVDRQSSRAAALPGLGDLSVVVAQSRGREGIRRPDRPAEHDLRARVPGPAGSRSPRRAHRDERGPTPEHGVVRRARGARMGAASAAHVVAGCGARRDRARRRLPRAAERVGPRLVGTVVLRRDPRFHPRVGGRSDRFGPEAPDRTRRRRRAARRCRIHHPLRGLHPLARRDHRAPVLACVDVGATEEHRDLRAHGVSAPRDLALAERQLGRSLPPGPPDRGLRQRPEPGQQVRGRWDHDVRHPPGGVAHAAPGARAPRRARRDRACCEAPPVTRPRWRREACDHGAPRHIHRRLQRVGRRVRKDRRVERRPAHRHADLRPGGRGRSPVRVARVRRRARRGAGGRARSSTCWRSAACSVSCRVRTRTRRTPGRWAGHLMATQPTRWHLVRARAPSGGTRDRRRS